MSKLRFSHRISKTVLIGSALGVLLAACTVGPSYQEPRQPVPARWSELTAGGVRSAAVDVKHWWSVFRDPQLDSLIKRATSFNKDLRLAAARIREARAQRGIVAADAFPGVNVAGTYTRSRFSENSSSFGAGAQGGAASAGGTTTNIGDTQLGGFSNEQDLFQVGFDARWEIDVFGGVRRAVEAAEADIGASEENRRDVLITLLAEVAQNYLEVRGSQRRIVIALKNIETQRKTLQLTQSLLGAGLSTSLNLSQTQAQLATTESQLPVLETSVKRGIHRLGVLLGVAPGALLTELAQATPIPGVPPQVPVGLPSDLLRRRPDVRRAERELAASTARIGVATADLFPKFSLTGSLGRQSVDISDLVKSGSGYWNFGPTISWPVFDAGRIRANIEVQDARQEQALIAYEKAVLNSLEDVENALVAYSREQARRTSLQQTVAANRAALDAAKALYSKGLVDFLNVLVNQGALYQSEDQLVQSDQQVATNLVALFKALGGGWETTPG